MKQELKRFVRAKLWTDEGRPNWQENEEARKTFGAPALPLIIILDPDGKEIGRLPPPGQKFFIIGQKQLLEALRKIGSN